MLYVKIENGRAVSATTEYPERDRQGRMLAGYETRNDWGSLDRASVVAIELSDATGTHYVAIDAGPTVSPRYDVIDMPTVGAKVSSAFNGDYYPEGVIVKISASLRRIVTSTGKVFFRRGQSGAWIEGGTWSMVAGHVDRRNPSF